MQRILLLSFLVAAPSALLAQTPCTGHFVNQSNYSWSISGFSGSGSQLVIAPGTSAVIPYGASTTVTISGNVPNRPFTMQFQLQQNANGCPTIVHSGNPGYITLNSPNPGDIVTCAGGC